MFEVLIKIVAGPIVKKRWIHLDYILPNLVHHPFLCKYKLVIFTGSSERREKLNRKSEQSLNMLEHFNRWRSWSFQARGTAPALSTALWKINNAVKNKINTIYQNLNSFFYESLHIDNKKTWTSHTESVMIKHQKYLSTCIMEVWC